MDALDNIQLPPATQTEAADAPAASETSDLNTNALPVINTDDLPITPLRSKRWLNNVTPSPDLMKPKACLNFAPGFSSSSDEIGNSGLPNTDNLLDISVPKTTLLGKEQAKKRLHAFSLSKQNNLTASPLLKKKNPRQPKFLLQAVEDAYNENGEKTDEKFTLIKKPAKRSINPNEKAKAVIEEIEEIKKIETACREAFEQELKNRRSRSRSRSRERSRRRSKKFHKRSRSQSNSKPNKPRESKCKYPTSWLEMKSKNLELLAVAAMKSKDHRHKDDSSDFRDQLLFQKPSLPIHRLTIKCVNGKEKCTPVEYIRFTNKSPQISYGITERMPCDCFVRQYVLQYVPKSYRDAMKKIIYSKKPTNNDTYKTAGVASRKWFSKVAFTKQESDPECKVLETSLGLSFLQTYSDGDEHEKESAGDVETCIAGTKGVNENVTESEKVVQNNSGEGTPINEQKYDLEEIKRTETKSEDKHSVESTKEVKKLKQEKKSYKYKIKKVKHSKKKNKTHKKEKCDSSKKKKFEQFEDEVAQLNKESRNRSKSKDARRSRSISNEKAKKTSRKRSKSEDDRKKSKKNRVKDRSKSVEKATKSVRHTSISIDEAKSLGRQRSLSSDSVKKLAKDINKPMNHKYTITPDKNLIDETKRYQNRRSLTENDIKTSKEAKKSTSSDNIAQISERSLSIEKIEHLKKRNSGDRSFFDDEVNESLKNRNKSTDESKEDSKKELAKSSFKRQNSKKRSSSKDNKESDLQKKDKDKEKREKCRTRSRSLERESDKTKNKSTLNKETAKVKCVAEKEFGTPDTEEYFSHWESDIELNTSLPKHSSSDMLDQMTSLNQSWQSNDEQFDINIPLKKSPMRCNESSDESYRRIKRIYKRDTSDDKIQRSSLRNKSSSPLRRSHCLDDFALHTSPVRSKFSPLSGQISPTPQEFSPFANRCIEERRRSRHSMEKPLFSPRSSPEKFPEMPFNIRNARNVYSRKKWNEEDRHFDSNKYSHHSPSSENKIYSLYSENSWERDDYNFKTEGIRVGVERRAIMEERRRLALERQHIEELERKRLYYLPKYDEEYQESEDGRRDIFDLSNDEENRYEEERSYREDRNHLVYSKASELNRSVSPENQRLHRSQELQRDITYDSFSWEDSIESKRPEKFAVRPLDKQPSKRRRESRWQDADDELPHQQLLPKVEHKVYGNKERKTTLKNSWENSEDDFMMQSIKRIEKIKGKCDEFIRNRNEDMHKEGDREKPKRTYGGRTFANDLTLSSQKSVQVQKPEVLEDEYEKFMQSLRSEKEAQQKKQRLKYRASSGSASSDEELLVSKRAAKKRKVRRKVSSSSSSSSSTSSSSDSESSSDSSLKSSSSDGSSSDEKTKKVKLKAVKIKTEKPEYLHEESAIQSTRTDISSSNSMLSFGTLEKETAKILKTEDSQNFQALTMDIKPLLPSPKSTNLNIIKLSKSEFSLGEIPLPNPSTVDVPRPVPSPKITVAAPMSSFDHLIIPEIEPEVIAPVPPVTQQSFAVPEPTQTEQTLPEENKPVSSSSQAETTPSKRNNLIPIKFLTPELRKQATESPNLKSCGVIDIKQQFPAASQAFKKNEVVEELPLTNRKRHFALSSINLSTNRSLFESSDDENSADFTDKFIKRDIKEEVTTSANFPVEMREEPKEFRERSLSKEREKRNSEFRKSRSMSPYKRRELSPRRDSRSPRRDSRSPRRNSRSPSRRDSKSPRRGDYKRSPRRWERDLSPRGKRRRSPERWERDISPKRGKRDTYSRRSRERTYRRSAASPIRREDRRDRRSLSPRDSRSKRLLSPRRRSPSPRKRSLSREFSPRRHRPKDRSSSRERRESIQEALQRIAGMDKYNNPPKASPLSSPLDGFKRSVADSTISDDQLLQRNLDEYNGSPSYNTEFYGKGAVTNFSSPKRISLDERINQALGLSEQPKPITTTYSQNFQNTPQYFDQYGQYYEQYNEQKGNMYSHRTYPQSRQRECSNLKVRPFSNIIEVVPTEDLTKHKPTSALDQASNKFLQIGNVLQIVPSVTLAEGSVPLPPPPATPTTVATTTSPTVSISTKEPLNAEALIKQKAERRAEKDRRRQERERKRKEKEKKRKEREKRKQLKVKLQTEAMIKQALMQETEGFANDENNQSLENTTQPRMQWPPVPQIVFNSSPKPATKGILCQGLRSTVNKSEEGDLQTEKRKFVKFSDGVIPGEGTSPSGGEELTSPPPAPKKLPKEKRYIKTKIPKKFKVPKKKVKVKVIRQPQAQGAEDEDDDEDDNLPPPPPPPGSPPPHVFPARIKPPPINNIHPNVIVSSIANPPLQPPTDTSFPPPPYRTAPPPPPIMMPHGSHHGPPHLPPHGPPPGHHHLPPPCPPPHHGVFNTPPPVVAPPPVVIQVPSCGPPVPPPHHHHHHHDSGHHHHHHH